MVGNALEVREAIATLAGRGPRDLEELCCELGAELLVLAKKETDRSQAIADLRDLLHDGSALAKFEELVRNQGGDPSVVDDPSLLPAASTSIEVSASRNGTVSRLDALAVGRAANLLGAGRLVKEDTIDPAVGIELLCKVGDKTRGGQPLAILHANDETNLVQARGLVETAYTIGKESASPPPALIVERVPG